MRRSRRCIQLLYIYLLVASSFGNCLLAHSLSLQVSQICVYERLLSVVVNNIFIFPFQVVDSPKTSSNSRNDKAYSPLKQYLMQSYYQRYTSLHDSDFDNFMSEQVTCW